MKRLWLGGLGFCLVLTALLLVLAWGSLKASASREDAQQWETHTRDVLLAAKDTLSALQDAETGQRGYLLTMRPDYLEPYQAGVQKFAEATQRLAALTQDNAGQQARIADLRRVAAAKLTELAETVSLAQSGNQAGALAVVVTDRGKILMDEARGVLHAISVEEDGLLVDRQVAARNAAAYDQFMSFTLVLIGAIALLTAMAATIWGLGSAKRVEAAEMSAAVTEATEAAKREAALIQATAALRDSEGRLQAIFDTVPVGIVIAEAPTGRLVTANQQAVTIFRHPMLHSPDVRHYRDWVAFHPDGRQVAAEEYPLARALAGEERPELEVLYQRGDGTQGWVRLIAAAITDRTMMTGTRITGAVVVALDIDRETRALAEVSEARRSLETRVTQEVQAREVTQGRLVQAEKLTALGQLAGGIAHDFNNVLQAVSGSASLIGKHADEPAKILRYVTMVETAAARGASITHRLLAFSRRGELRADAIHLPELLDGMHEVLTHTLGASYVIRTDAETGLLPGLADRGQLETVLVNLATNARDAMQSGGIITLSANSETVTDDRHPAGLASGNYVRLTVEDTGTGMDRPTLARIMEPFFTTKGPGKGTGLGLPMARGFAEQSGGALAVVSEPGRGTKVMLWLPVTQAMPQSEPENLAPERQTRQPRILLVDDEALVREVLAEQLGDSGYDVVEADCGEAALALLDTGEPIDLIVSDLAMPGMNGVALLQEAHLRRPRLPGILLTGYAGDAASLAVGGAIGGSFSLLRKPVSGPQLIDRIDTLLEALAIS